MSTYTPPKRRLHLNFRSRITYDGSRTYPGYAPLVIFRSVRHWLIGPLLGCSCSSCFYSKWRIEYPARDRYQDRIRLSELEDRVDDLEADPAVEQLAGRVDDLESTA